MIELGRLEKITSENSCGIVKVVDLDPNKRKSIRFGRDPARVDVLLDSKKFVCIISRLHASIEYKDGIGWNVTDMSQNGVWINKMRLLKGRPTPLRDGDSLVFGGVNASEFAYRYTMQRRESQEEIQARERRITEQALIEEKKRNEELKRKSEEEKARLNEEKIAKEKEVERLRQALEEMKEEAAIVSEKANRKFIELQKKTRERIAEQVLIEEKKRNEELKRKAEEEKARLNEEKKAKEKEVESLRQALEEMKEKAAIVSEKAKEAVRVKRKFIELQKKTREEEEERRKRMKLLEEENKAKEEARMQLEEELKRRTQEIEKRKKDLTSLKENYNKIEIEMKTKLDAEEKAAKERVLKLREENSQKERDRIELENKLKDLLAKTTQDKQQQLKLQNSLDAIQKEKEEFHAKLKNMELANKKALEDLESRSKKELDYCEKRIKDLTHECSKGEDVFEQLECSICCEAFIDPRTLPCSHSFCEMCIRDHLRRKDDCPVCRRKASVPIPSLTLANMAKKLMMNKSKEEQEAYAEIVKSREKKTQEAELLYKKLVETISGAKATGENFFHIMNTWKDHESKVFLKNMQRYDYPKTRRAYAAVVGLEDHEIAKMSRKQLLLAASNLKLKDMLKENVMEIRRRLTLFLTYGTKVFVDV